MLVLSPESGCDVCAETYSQDALPHAVPFCASCLSKIAKGIWSPRVGAGCPLCREPFTQDQVLRIRIDQSLSSSPPYPHVLPYPNYYPAGGTGNGAAARNGFGVAPLDEDALDDVQSDDRAQREARRLEARVLEVAGKASFEQLSSLYREIDAWLARQKSRRPGQEYGSLKVSCALLNAILVNGFKWSEDRKAANTNESSLKEKLDSVVLDKRRLEVDLHRTKMELAKVTGAPLPPPLAAVMPPAVPPMPPGARALGSGLVPRPGMTPASAVPPSMRSQTPGPSPTHRAMTPGPARAQTPAASAYPHYPRATPSTSHLPISPERHQRWVPSTTRDADSDRDRDREPRPGTAFGNHHRQYSIGASLHGQRPQTAAPTRR